VTSHSPFSNSAAEYVLHLQNEEEMIFFDQTAICSGRMAGTRHKKNASTKLALSY
jgi:hypothetical protein